MMFNRINREVVDIRRSFEMSDPPRTFPPGRYEITTEEEPLGDGMRPVYRRISTTIYLPRRAGDVGLGEIIEIEPAELQRLTSEPADL
jgi:hypothetical protein